MDIILPVAGLGTRLRPQTWSKPKPLVALAGKPMLAHVLDRVLPLDPSRVIFITGFLGDHMEAWARANVPVPVEFVVQPEMKGQTDAIIRTRHLGIDDALILFPDMLFEADFSGLSSTDADVVMFTKEVDDPSALGIAVVDGERIVRLVEKPKDLISRLAVVGIYYFKSMTDLYDAIDVQMERGISLKNEYFIADAIQLMIESGRKVVPAPVTLWEDCGNSDALLSTNRILLSRGETGTRVLGDSVVIEPSAIDPSATLERSVIGPYASISAGAIVRDSIVRDSIVDERAVISAAIVEQSLIGRGAVVNGRPSRLNVGDVSVVTV
ncbi:MAG: NTP transferase domain-containing protein [Thermomicrobiales bacterium]|nr:NTP transferase domain-containing protein [Thermomicrobiales bacterium]